MIPIMSPEFEKIKHAKWIEFQCDDPEKQWVLGANTSTMDFGGVFHSVYLRWAVTINGLHVAAEKYKSESWLNSGKVFAVSGLRNKPDGSGISIENIQIWDGIKASEVHETSVPMLSAWAFCNMYSSLEEFIFKLFRHYLNSYPITICEGNNFRHLRQVYKAREKSQENLNAWETVWEERLGSWHRKKLYDGIEKVFNNFVAQSGIDIPSFYKCNYHYSDIAKTLGGISMIRNCFIHGATEVPEELGEFCKTSFFNFKTGDKFEITLEDLQTLEYFTDTFTQTLNNSFFEYTYPNIKF
jgi:hypothetical protein